MYTVIQKRSSEILFIWNNISSILDKLSKNDILHWWTSRVCTFYDIIPLVQIFENDFDSTLRGRIIIWCQMFYEWSYLVWHCLVSKLDINFPIHWKRESVILFQQVVSNFAFQFNYRRYLNAKWMYLIVLLWAQLH